MPIDGGSRSFVTLILLMVFSVVFVIYTTAHLPEVLATHFAADGRADGWMTRGSYLLLMISVLIGVPALVSFCVGSLPRKFPHLTNIPNREYWLAPQRLDGSLHFLRSHSQRLGRLIVMLMTGMHYAIVVANRAQPPALPGSLMMALLVGFLFALVLWVVALYRRFRKAL